MSKIKNGLYFIDDNYKVLYFNDAVKRDFPEAHVGGRCYEILACRDNPCNHCPLKVGGRQDSFYNSSKGQWINARAAQLTLPQFGNCYSITYTLTDEKSHKKLQKFNSRKELLDYFDSNKIGMFGFYCEENFPIFFANDEMVKMVEYETYNDFYNRVKGQVKNTIHPEDLKQVLKDIGKNFFVGYEYETIYRMLRKNGQYFWVHNRGRVVEVENGKLAIISYFTDISDLTYKQKILESEKLTLLQQYRLMEFINQGMPGGYHRCDVTEGHPLLYVSQKFLTMTGFTRDEIVTKFDNKFFNMIHPDDRTYIIGATNDALLKGTSDFSFKYRIATKNGYLQVIDNTNLSNFDGVKFFQGVIVDISKEEQLKEHVQSLEIVSKALEDSLNREQKYRHKLDELQNEILDSVSCGVLAFTLKDKRLITVNNAVKNLIGCGKNQDIFDCLRKFLYENILPEDREVVFDAQKRLSKKGDFVSQDYRALIDGKLTYIHAFIKHLETSDGQAYILVTMLDTTQQAVLTSVIKKERKAYREALAHGSEFSFLMDVTQGLITEEFVTAHGINLVKSMGFEVPVCYDTLLSKYVEVCNIQFGSEDMRANFTIEGLKRAYSQGKTNVITEFYNPVRDMFFRVNCLLSKDDETGRILASIVADDVTEIRKKDRAQREALEKANQEMNIRINTILDGISGGLIIADMNDYSYLYISEGTAKLQGYTVEDFLKKHKKFTSNIYIDKDKIFKEAKDQIDSNGYYCVKYRVQHQDGTIKWVMDNGKLVYDANTGKSYLYALIQDITDLESRNLQLSKVLTMQKNMADSLGNGIFAYTIPQYEVLILNQEAKIMFDCLGTDPKNYGKDIISKIIPEDMPTVRTATAKLNAPGDQTEYIFHSIAVDGNKKSFKCNTKLLNFQDGQKYILSAITDITEQELLEARLDEERRQYRNALTFNSLGFMTVDLTTGYADKPVNNKDIAIFTQRFGVKIPVKYDALVTKWMNENRIVSSSENIEYVKSIDKLVECCKKGNSILELEYHVPEQNKYYNLIILLYKIQGHFKASFIVYDITSSKQEENKKRSIIDSLGKIYLALYHFSFTDNLCTLLKANDDIIKELPDQSTFDDFYDLYTSKYVIDQYKDELKDFLNKDNIKQALADTDYVSVEFKRLNLGWCRVTLVCAERDANGVVTSVVFAGNIIEKQKQKELAQQEALKTALQSANIANSAKTNFLANMSHDIRTPMNAIIGMTAIAGTHLEDKERVKDCLNKITTSSKHLLGIINDVLDMSKIESGKIELQETEFNITDLIDNLITITKTGINEKQHQLSVVAHSVKHEDVIGDSQRLQQVFMNLMSNAIKYTPNGGKITLSITEKSTNKPLIGCYEVIFEDNGIGMSKDSIDHIFEPFSRAKDDTRVDKIQGTGLGMSITKNILQMMNGDIKVESKLNQGTKITIKFFLRLKDTIKPVTYEKFADLPILVVDDEVDSCEYTCELLKDIGMKGEWVQSGKQALNKIVERHNACNDYYAVILDWKMPELDGIETTRLIREKVGKNIPVIILSAYDWSVIEYEARSAGVNAFISKPIFKSRLIHVFNELLDLYNDETTSNMLDEVAKADFSGKRVLLVEDNSLNAEIADEVLKMAGFSVEFAVNGKEAVDIMTNVKDDYYSAILMDVQMPIMNGYEATRAIRSLPSNYAKSVPIFAMTANAFAEDVQSAKSVGMNEHISKPIDFSQLIATLKKWIK